MNHFEKRFIFRKRQRKLTVVTVLLITPLLLAALSIFLVKFGIVASLATYYTNFLISLPNWALALAYILFPVMSVYYSFKLASRGTLHKLRGFNRLVGIAATTLILLEVVVVLMR